MFESNEKEKDVSKLQLAITLFLVLFLAITGATYAYFAATDFDGTTITGNMATVNLTLNVDKIFPTNSNGGTGVMVPQLGTTAPLTEALQNGCVDENTNVACQVYKISIQNVGGTATQVIDGNLTFYGDSDLTEDISTAMPRLRWKKISSVDVTTPANSVLGNSSTITASSDDILDANIFADNVTLATNDYEEYYIIVWINEISVDQPDDKASSFYGKVEFVSSNGTGVTATFAS